MSITKYRDSTVALIDILGFSRIVRSLKNDENGEKQRKIDAGINVLKNAEEQLKTEIFKKFIDKEGDLRATMFSDTIVCTSASANSLRVVFQAHMIGCGLMAAGFLCRGGISRGSSFHEDNIFYGDAVIDAYHLESKLASYPRILVDNDIADSFRKSIESNPKIFSGSFLRRDTDGLWYVNVFDGPTGYLLANKSQNWPQVDISKYWESTDKCIQSGLKENAGDVSVYAKYVWAANKFNEQAPKSFACIKI